ncbi:MAG: CCA tRNA nucleotidyltransferase [Candidatus Latescibacteria bacterium]|nr:CCA tRNA nucleotidyltransferase [Candidatus Latescibacterota bacterium]
MHTVQKKSNSEPGLDMVSGVDLSGPMEARLSPKVRTLFADLGQAADAMGCALYLVGGWPRDLLLNRPNFDVDVVVEGDGVAFAEAFVSKKGGRVVSHERFQTAMIVLEDGCKVDVVSARRERYDRPGALPAVELSGIEQDLYRRDFTINSMAIQLNAVGYGRLVDLFGGRRDLRQKTLRVLHKRSFVEDPTRIMRAVRFEQRFGFRMERTTEQLLRRAVADRMLGRVSPERIREELILLLREERPFKPLLRLDELGVLRTLHPGLRIDGDREDLFARIGETLSWFGQRHPDDEVDRWMLFFLGLMDALGDEEKSAFAEKWHMPRKVRELVREIDSFPEVLVPLTQAHISASRTYRSLKPLSIESVLFLMARTTEESVEQRIELYLDRLRNASISLSGRDLDNMGIPQGPIFSMILDKVINAKIDGKVCSKEEELAWAGKIWKESGKA